MSTDGIDHINIYSKGDTYLGRSLSNFSSHKVATTDGEFASIEGYWYWLNATGPRREELRAKVGWEAKRLGRELRAGDWSPDPTFKLRIANAMVSKLILHPQVCSEFVASTLSFRHYYVYGDKVVEPAEGRWIVALWEHLRQMVKG
jgi:hypothetical protein